MATKAFHLFTLSFFQKNSNLDINPPTENALFHHCQRAIYQTGVWGRCLETYQSLPVPSDFGWQRSNNSDVPWEPVWVTNGEASKEVGEFVKCKCQGAAGCVRYKFSIQKYIQKHIAKLY